MEANLVTDLGANCGGGPMASALSVSLDGGLVALSPSGVHGQGPRWGSGAKHPEADSIFVNEQQNLAAKGSHHRFKDSLFFTHYWCEKSRL